MNKEINLTNINCLELIKNGSNEKDVAKALRLSIETFYSKFDFQYGSEQSRNTLKHYCGGCSNGICFAWPLMDEKYCPVHGYEPKCPLKKSKSEENEK